MMPLKEEIKSLTGRKRKFFLLRVADMDTDVALNLCNVPQGTYNSWLHSDEFVTLYRRREELTGTYKHEAIQLLRRDNQLEAVLLEGKIITKLKEELDSGEYNLIRSQLAREVYSKLISDLDVVPKLEILSWEERMVQIITPTNTPSLMEGDTINAEFKEISQPETEPQKSQLITEGEQTIPQVEEEIQG